MSMNIDINKNSIYKLILYYNENKKKKINYKT